MRVVNNLDWFGGMGFLAFLREVGKFARVGTMIAKDSVRPPSTLRSIRGRGSRGRTNRGKN
jgi:tyrosyl-tRNA synthetase